MTYGGHGGVPGGNARVPVYPSDGNGIAETMVRIPSTKRDGSPTERYGTTKTCGGNVPRAVRRSQNAFYAGHGTHANAIEVTSAVVLLRCPRGAKTDEPAFLAWHKARHAFLRSPEGDRNEVTGHEKVGDRQVRL